MRMCRAALDYETWCYFGDGKAFGPRQLHQRSVNLHSHEAVETEFKEVGASIGSLSDRALGHAGRWFRVPWML